MRGNERSEQHINFICVFFLIRSRFSGKYAYVSMLMLLLSATLYQTVLCETSGQRFMLWGGCKVSSSHKESEGALWKSCCFMRPINRLSVL